MAALHIVRRKRKENKKVEQHNFSPNLDHIHNTTIYKFGVVHYFIVVTIGNLPKLKPGVFNGHLTYLTCSLSFNSHVDQNCSYLELSDSYMD